MSRIMRIGLLVAGMALVMPQAESRAESKSLSHKGNNRGATGVVSV